MKLDPITIEILRDRLLAIVNEADVVATRTAFSSIIRDVHDYSCSLFDNQGRLLVQGTLVTPGHVGSMARCIKTIVDKDLINLKDLKPGDVFITNDPWLLAGHLLDVMILTPVFYHTKLVAFAATLFHHMDIGGTIGAGNKEIYEEGIQIPLLKFYEGGVLDQAVFDIIHANVRMADRILGDIKAEVAANDLMATKLSELLDELQWENISELAEEIFTRTESGTRAEIEKFPDGMYRGEGYIERQDCDEPIRIKVAIEIRGSNIHADFEGSSPQVNVGINSVYNYTYAHYVYAIKTLIDPLIPNNDGTLRCMTMSAPEGSIVNAKFPAASIGRTSVGLILECIIYRILSEAIPERVIAQSGSAPLWWITYNGTTREGHEFMNVLAMDGGLGARFNKDGISCLSFPANIRTNSIEMFEADTPLLCEKKELIGDSGGPGKFRGGLGQEVVLVVPKGSHGLTKPVVESAIAGRLKYPALGVLGGRNGSLSEIYINDRTTLIKSRGYHYV
jgi:N-methylhydantoinase B